MTALLWILAAWVVAAIVGGLGLGALIGANDAVARVKRYADGQNSARELAEAEADYWHNAYVTLSRESSNVRPISAAPSFDRITDLLAANEIARADWTEPGTWSDGA